MEPLFQRVDAAFAAVAATRHLRLCVVGTRVWVDSDPLLLERILFNLVSNAVRYTETGGAVLGVRRRGDMVAIEVCDSGIGISALQRKHIFDEFYQVDAGERQGGRGMGLGLAIIRRLAALQHEVEVESAPGRGRDFPSSCGRSPMSANRLHLPRRVEERHFPRRADRGDRRRAHGRRSDARMAGKSGTVVGHSGKRCWAPWANAALSGPHHRRYRLEGGALGTDAVALLRHELGCTSPRC